MWPFKKKPQPKQQAHAQKSVSRTRAAENYVFAKQLSVQSPDNSGDFVTGMVVGAAIGGSEGALLGGMIGGAAGGIIGGEIAKMDETPSIPDPAPVEFGGGDSGGAGASSSWDYTPDTPCDTSSSDSSSYDSSSSSDCGSSDSGSSGSSDF